MEEEAQICKGHHGDQLQIQVSVEEDSLFELAEKKFELQNRKFFVTADQNLQIQIQQFQSEDIHHKREESQTIQAKKWKNFKRAQRRKIVKAKRSQNLKSVQICTQMQSKTAQIQA